MNNKKDKINTLHSIEIYKRLDKKLNTNLIFVKINKYDELLIHISGYRRTTYRMIIKNVNYKLNEYHLSEPKEYDDVVNTVLIEYEKYIKKLFFKGGG